MKKKTRGFYSEEFKWRVVQEVLEGKYTKEEVRRVYNIKSKCAVLYWMRKFSGNDNYRQGGVPLGKKESQFVDIFYQRWTRLFIQYDTEPDGWEWQVYYSDVKPSNTRVILIYPRVVGPISVKIRRNNE
jgi:hypothetical protein